MEENNKKKMLLFLLPELGCMVLAALGIWGLAFAGMTAVAKDKMVCHIVLAVLGIGIVGFAMRENELRGDFDYDNDRHVLRFWVCFLVGLVVSLVCALLPAAAWPFLPLFVCLTLFSNLGTGVLAGAVLLALPVCMSGSGAEIYLLYIISGVFGAVMFRRLKNGFRTGIPLLLTLVCLLVCLTAGTVLIANARPGLEYFVVPVANLIVSGILLFGILKYSFAKIIYLYRDNYLELNNSENQILGELKQKDKGTYLRCVHTGYFCERIGGRLQLDADALKCAAYYHNWKDVLPELPEKYFFPPEVIAILEDYWKSGRTVHKKETAVLKAAVDVIGRVLELLAMQGDKDACWPLDKNIDYDKEIDAIFQGYYENDVFGQCDISVRELQVMRRIFKEEKLYYDFLR